MACFCRTDTPLCPSHDCELHHARCRWAIGLLGLVERVALVRGGLCWDRPALPLACLMGLALACFVGSEGGSGRSPECSLFCMRLPRHRANSAGGDSFDALSMTESAIGNFCAHICHCHTCSHVRFRLCIAAFGSASRPAVAFGAPVRRLSDDS